MKTIIKFLAWVIRKVYASKHHELIEPCIKDIYGVMVQANRSKYSDFLKKEYMQLRKDEFVIKAEIVKVKKGQRKYDLLFIEDGNGKIKINISRHFQGVAEETIHSPKVIPGLIVTP